MLARVDGQGVHQISISAPAGCLLPALRQGVRRSDHVTRHVTSDYRK